MKTEFPCSLLYPSEVWMCEHCKKIWINKPIACKCGRKFFVPTHKSNAGHAEDVQLYTA